MNENKNSVYKHPDYVKASEKLTALQVEGNSIEAKLGELQLAINSNGREGKTLGQSKRDAAVKFISTGKYDEKLAIRNEMNLLRKKQNILNEAIQIQKKSVEDVRTRLSKEICAALAQAHEKRVKNIMDAFTILETENNAEDDFRKALEAEGVIVSFRPMVIPEIGRLSEPGSLVSRYWHECQQYGFIEQKEGFKANAWG